MADRDLFKEITGLTTEQRNERTRTIDLATSEDIVAMINREDAGVAAAVAGAALLSAWLDSGGVAH